MRYDSDDLTLILRITNQSHSRTRVRIASAYWHEVINDELPRGRALERRFSLRRSFGWYDLSVTSDADSGFLWRFAGHLENGRDSASDPQLG